MLPPAPPRCCRRPLSRRRLVVPARSAWRRRHIQGCSRCRRCNCSCSRGRGAGREQGAAASRPDGDAHRVPAHEIRDDRARQARRRERPGQGGVGLVAIVRLHARAVSWERCRRPGAASHASAPNTADEASSATPDPLSVQTTARLVVEASGFGAASPPRAGRGRRRRRHHRAASRVRGGSVAPLDCAAALEAGLHFSHPPFQRWFEGCFGDRARVALVVVARVLAIALQPVRLRDVEQQAGIVRQGIRAREGFDRRVELALLVLAQRLVGQIARRRRQVLTTFGCRDRDGSVPAASNKRRETAGSRFVGRLPTTVRPGEPR